MATPAKAEGAAPSFQQELEGITSRRKEEKTAPPQKKKEPHHEDPKDPVAPAQQPVQNTSLSDKVSEKAPEQESPADPATQKVANEPCPKENAQKTTDVTPDTTPVLTDTTPAPEDLDLERTVSPTEVADVQGVIEDDHAIAPKDTPKLAVDIAGEDGKKILDSLFRVAQETAVKPPVRDKISPKILETLKASDAPIVQHLEDTPRGDVALQQLPKNNDAPAAKPQEPIYQTYTERFQHLKGSVVEQVRFQLHSNEEGTSKVVIRLKPQQLGNIKISMTFEDSQAKANFVVDTHSVKELLQRSIHDLQQALKESGVDVNEVNITVADPNSGHPDGSHSFASTEDQQVAREWVKSFVTAPLQDTEQPQDNNLRPGTGSGEFINVIA